MRNIIKHSAWKLILPPASRVAQSPSTLVSLVTTSNRKENDIMSRCYICDKLHNKPLLLDDEGRDICNKCQVVGLDVVSEDRRDDGEFPFAQVPVTAEVREIEEDQKSRREYPGGRVVPTFDDFD
jgi:hypothetical protein